MKIFDTSSIVCIFREAKCTKALDVCTKHGYVLSVTKQVYEELKDNPDTFNMFQLYDRFVIIDEIDNSCMSILANRYPWMHTGEISVICAGMDKQSNGQKYHCIIDERARTLKDKYNIKVNGTIGFLIWQKNQLNEWTKAECEKLYHTIKQSSFWVKDDILRGLLK